MPLRRRLLKPDRRLPVVLRDTDALVVALGQLVLRQDMALHRRFREPLERLLLILRDALPGRIRRTQPVVDFGVFFGGQ